MNNFKQTFTITIPSKTGYMDLTDDVMECVRRANIKNGICTILLNVKCISPVNGWLTVTTTVPKALNFYICGTLESNPGVDTLKCSIATNGKLQFSQGTAGKTYIGSLMYQVAES